MKSFSSNIFLCQELRKKDAHIVVVKKLSSRVIERTVNDPLPEPCQIAPVLQEREEQKGQEVIIQVI